MSEYFHENPNVFYSETCVPSAEIESSLEHILDGCLCNDSCRPSTCLCTTRSGSGSSIIYDDQGRIPQHDFPIFECKASCQCDPISCLNRVVQKGPIQGLKVISSGDKGKGLICQQDLKQGTFVCEYAGELITQDTAQARSTKDLKMNYILHAIEHFGGNDKKQVTVIDPTFIGNIGRYANHSCDPNLSLHLVRIETLTPRVALFTNKDIKAGEELTFDYGYENDGGNEKNGCTKCLCGSKNCRGFLPFHKSIINK